MISALLIVSASLQTSPPFMRSPDIHGDTVVFTTEGDLWLGDLKSGKAQRLTRDVGTEFDARFSPDGKMIGYTGELEGVREIYVMPTNGGAPKRLTYLNDFAELVDWRDDDTLVFRARSYPAQTAPTLYTVDLDGAPHKRLPLEFASGASFAPDGNRFAFTRFNRFGAAWFRYEGGLKNAIWLGDLKSLSFKIIHEGQATCEFPTWCGDRLYFATYRGANFYLGSTTPEGTGPRKEGADSDVEIRYLQTDGKNLVYERGFGVELYDPVKRRAEAIKFDMVSDLLHTRPYLVSADANVFHSSIGPAGKRVLVETRGQIVSLGVKEGDARVLLVKDGIRFRHPVFSPDGKRIAYFSDAPGDLQLYVADADGQNPKQLTSDPNRQLKRVHWSPDSRLLGLTTSDRDIRIIDPATGSDKRIASGAAWGWEGPPFSFSPDGKWVVFSDFDFWTGVGSIVLYDIPGGKSHRVSQGLVDDFWPVFSQDGRYIAFLSRRNLVPTWDPIQNHLNLAANVKPYLLVLSKDAPSPLSPKEEEEGTEAKEEPKPPFRLDLEGLYGRFVELPLPPSNYSQIAFAGDRVLAVDGSDSKVRYYDLKAKEAGVLSDSAGLMEVSADGKKVLLASGANIRVVDAGAKDSPGSKVSFANLQLRVDPRAEWNGIYWDAWRHIRDYFYAANMHGLDWPAVGRKYAAFLPSVRSRDELNQLIRWMLAELGTSHASVGGGDVRSLLKTAAPSFLGMDVEPSGGYLKITKILRGGDFLEGDRSPLAAPGLNVKEGEYLIDVAGRPARADSDWQEGLLGRAGQLVAIKVNARPSADGARTVKVKPVATETRMRYLQWVEDRRAAVAKATGGRVAYLHLRAMVASDLADFVRQYYPQRDREGLIVDVRFNTGGNVSDQVAGVLKQKLIGFFNQRGRVVPWTRQSDYFPGPMACLINEFNYSNGEEFPHQWKVLGLGPVIGQRTRGGEVGSDPGWPMADGGIVSVPNYGMFTEKEGWIIEGPGVPPDVPVVSDPNLWARGRDPQLEKAIELVIEALRKNPVKRPGPPADPVKIR